MPSIYGVRPARRASARARCSRARSRWCFLNAVNCFLAVLRDTLFSWQYAVIWRRERLYRSWRTLSTLWPCQPHPQCAPSQRAARVSWAQRRDNHSRVRLRGLGSTGRGGRRGGGAGGRVIRALVVTDGKIHVRAPGARSCELLRPSRYASGSRSSVAIEPVLPYAAGSR